MRRLYIIFGLSYFVLLPLCALAAGNPENNTTGDQNSSTQSQCGFDGNIDLYGVGIRIGYYAQAISVAFANFFVLQESKVLRSVNTLFMLAMSIGLVWISHTPSQTYAVEAFMLLQLVLAIWLVGVQDVSRWSTKFWSYDPARVIIREISEIGILAYNFWFWHFGLEPNGFMPTPCGTYVFFVAKLELYGWFRSAHKVLSIMALIMQLPPLFEEMFKLLEHWRTRQIRSPGYFTRITEVLLQNPALGSNAEGDTCLKDEFRESGRIEYQDASCSHILEPEMGNDAQKAESLSLDSHEEPKTQSAESDIQIEVQNVPRSPSPQNAQSASSSTYTSLLVADIFTTHLIGPPYGCRSFNFKYRIPHTPITLSFPRLSRPFLPTFPRPYRFNLLLPLFHHIYNLYTHPFYTYPHLISVALSHPSYRTLDPNDLRIFLALRRTRLPAHHRKWSYLPSLITTSIFTLGLVLAIELGIRWNEIRGVGAVNGVGQLVPLVLGVGGLAKVGWAWLEGLWMGEEVKEDDSGEIDACAEVYYRMKEEREGRRLSGGQDQLGGATRGELV